MEQAKLDAIADAINSTEYTFCTQYGPDQPNGVIAAFDIQCRNSTIPVLDSMVFYFKSETVLAVSFFDKHEHILASTPDIDISGIDLIKTIPLLIENLFIDFTNHVLQETMDELIGYIDENTKPC